MIIASLKDGKVVYVARNPKDALVSLRHRHWIKQETPNNQ